MVSEASRQSLGSRPWAPNWLLTSVSEARGKLPCSGAAIGVRTGASDEVHALRMRFERAGPQIWLVSPNQSWSLVFPLGCQGCGSEEEGTVACVGVSG